MYIQVIYTHLMKLWFTVCWKDIVNQFKNLIKLIKLQGGDSHCTFRKKSGEEEIDLCQNYEQRAFSIIEIITIIYQKDSLTEGNYSSPRSFSLTLTWFQIWGRDGLC